MTEILEDEPEKARELFGVNIEKARWFTANLAREGEKRGLIGPRELPRLWSRHILNCTLLAPLVRGPRVADVGSGAGLPGLVLAIARPDVSFTLIEPMERRTLWLLEQVAELDLDNVTIDRARAENASSPGSFDQVTARAVSSIKKLLPLIAPLARPGGELLLMKGSAVDEERSAARRELQKYGVDDARVISLGGEDGIDETKILQGFVNRPNG